MKIVVLPTREARNQGSQGTKNDPKFDRKTRKNLPMGYEKCIDFWTSFFRSFGDAFGPPNGPQISQKRNDAVAFEAPKGIINLASFKL